MIYVVKDGDTIESIAAANSVSPALLQADNGIFSAQTLVPGQTLVIRYPSQLYTVKEGDTLNSIARDFQTSTVQLWQNNPILGGKTVLYPGQTLVIAYANTPQRSVAVNGYVYPFIQEDIYRRNLPYLTTVSVFTYGFEMDGTLVAPADEKLLSVAAEYGTAPILVFSSLGQDGRFNSGKASALFADPALQNRILDQLLAVMREKNYRGLELDFEYIPVSDRDNYIAFSQKTRARLEANGYFLVIDLAPKTSADQPGLLYEGIDYGALGEIGDILMLMTYEWGYKYGSPMAISPLPNVRAVVEYAVSAITSTKCNLGMPGYAYDWPLPFVQGESAAETISPRKAVDTARRNGVSISYDETAQSPFFYYTASDGVEHVVWFEDARSVAAKLDLINLYNLRGPSWWTVMNDFQQAWLALCERYRIQRL